MTFFRELTGALNGSNLINFIKLLPDEDIAEYAEIYNYHPGM